MQIKGQYYSGSIPVPANSRPIVVRVDANGHVYTTSAGASPSGETQVGGVYNSVVPTITDGDGEPLQLDVNGNLKVVEQFASAAEDNTNGVISGAQKPLAVTTYSPSLFTNFGANVTLNVKASAGNVFSLYARNLNAAVRFVQLHNTATTPAGGAVPLLSFPMAVLTGEKVLDHSFFSHGGIFFSTGIAFGFSTTEGTYTAATAADHSICVLYK